MFLSFKRDECLYKIHNVRTDSKSIFIQDNGGLEVHLEAR